jgi:hypothetical protein
MDSLGRVSRPIPDALLNIYCHLPDFTAAVFMPVETLSRGFIGPESCLCRAGHLEKAIFRH